MARWRVEPLLLIRVSQHVPYMVQLAREELSRDLVAQSDDAVGEFPG